MPVNSPYIASIYVNETMKQTVYPTTGHVVYQYTIVTKNVLYHYFTEALHFFKSSANIVHIFAGHLFVRCVKLRRVWLVLLLRK